MLGKGKNWKKLKIKAWQEFKKEIKLQNKTSGLVYTEILSRGKIGAWYNKIPSQGSSV